VPELSGILTARYAEYLREPEVSVIVKSIALVKVFVGGEVAQPGEQDNAGTASTLSQAIARAGGLKPSADEGRLFLIRRGEDDIPKYFAVRYDAVQGARDPLADIRLAPFDVVIAPKTGIAEVYRWYQQYIYQFVVPNLGFSYALNPTPAGQTILNQAK
jgi:polysaccharide export outer membrane protein